MPDSAVQIKIVGSRRLVMLTVSKPLVAKAQERMTLAMPHRREGADPASLWLAPGQWLLESDSDDVNSLVRQCTDRLQDILHCAVDQSDAFTIVQVSGFGARDLFAAGTSLDLRAPHFPVGSCSRTRFANIRAIIVARAPDQYNVFVDRSYERYFLDWLADSL